MVVEKCKSRSRMAVASTWSEATDVAKLIEQIRIARRLGARGFTVFNYDVAIARDVLPALGKGITRKGQTATTAPARSGP